MHKLKPQRTETFEHTIRGLLTKRRELHYEAEQTQGRLAEIKNDIIAIDRVLRALGHRDELSAPLPNLTRGRLFSRNELVTIDCRCDPPGRQAAFKPRHCRTDRH